MVGFADQIRGKGAIDDNQDCECCGYKTLSISCWIKNGDEVIHPRSCIARIYPCLQ
jgi:hypothetical protein